MSQQHAHPHKGRLQRFRAHACTLAPCLLSQIPDLQRTKAVRSLRELVFMHGRVDFAVEPLEDPPARLPADQGPSLSVSRSQFIREAEKRWRVSEILLQDLLVLEEQALRSGAVRLQSEVCKLPCGVDRVPGSAAHVKRGRAAGAAARARMSCGLP
jgi:hypothetical protein